MASSVAEASVSASARTITSSTKSALEYDWGLSPDLKELLQCPACGDTAIPPIFLCEQGHMICYICRGQVKKCPCCDSDYTTTRNELAESILDKCTFRCPFASQGCGETLRGSDVSGHFGKCDYRPVICHFYAGSGKPCEKKVDYNEHVHHVRNDHGVMGVNGASAVISMSTTVKLGQGNWTFPAHYMHAFGHTFWCNLHASYNLMIAWVTLSGTSDELNKYAAAITIFDPIRKWQQSKWIGRVHSIRSTAREVYNTGNCLALLPESFTLLSTIQTDEEGQKIKRWLCHFEIIEIEDPNQERDSPTPKTTSSTSYSDLEERPVGRSANAREYLANVEVLDTNLSVENDEGITDEQAAERLFENKSESSNVDSSGSD